MAKQAVYGIAKDRRHAERAVQALVDAGLKHTDISFLASNENQQFEKFSETTGSNRNWRTEERLTDYPTGTTPEQEFGREQSSSWDNPNASTRGTSLSKGNGSQKENMQGGLGAEKHTKAPEGATTGATAGGIIGGTLGLLAGIGALAIPGLGPFIAAGPLMATLAGIGTGGTLGGIIGALIGTGIPEYEAKRYENKLKEGGILLSVRADSDSTAKQVKEILQNAGVEDVSISSEASVSKNYNK